MASPAEIVSDYLALYRTGNAEDSFHGMLDHGELIIPDLIRAYDDAWDAPGSGEIQVFILEVVSALRSSGAAWFLRRELRRSEPPVWKAALDGLVIIGAVDDLEQVLCATPDEPKRSWIIEAIVQLREGFFP